ncbi:hypothetical protein [Comamonas jiangduensis]|uniref:hypothetical protein n=1 Tax=Comamonas jiangduensis TaxID=1194168 RepID=UPI0028AC6303|nr:hypothetical protein [Comamonas jiangduensis]
MPQVLCNVRQKQWGGSGLLGAEVRILQRTGTQDGKLVCKHFHALALVGKALAAIFSAAKG